MCSTPDFATPQDQQYDIAVDANDPSAVAIRSPAALSPNRIKRPRNAGEPSPANRVISQFVMLYQLAVQACS